MKLTAGHGGSGTIKFPSPSNAAALDARGSFSAQLLDGSITTRITSMRLVGKVYRTHGNAIRRKTITSKKVELSV